MSFGNSNFGFSGGGNPHASIGGGGTLNFIAKYAPNGTTIGNSQLFDNGVSVGLGTVTPDVSAKLDIFSTTQGFLAPRMTQTERDLIPSPAIGLFIFNTTSSKFNFLDGAAWQTLDSTIPPSGLTLAQTLSNGNVTGGMPIIMTSGDTLNFSVGSGGVLNSNTTTTARTWALPDKSGIIALVGITPTILDLSDVSIYDVTTSQITIPALIQNAEIFNCQVDLYDPATPYNINEIVRSDGTNGGVSGLSYKSLTNGNTGNLLSDGANWSYADAAGGNVGNIEVATFGNPNSLSTVYTSSFRIDNGSFTLLFVAGGSSPSTGQLFLDFNTSISMTNKYSEFTFANVFDVSVKQPAPVQ